MSFTQPIGTPPEPTHVDQFIDKLTTDPQEIYAAWVLCYFRLPAILKDKFREFMKDKRLFCTFEGKRWRVVGASRLGDVWLKGDGPENAFYDRRVCVDHCSEWADV